MGFRVAARHVGGVRFPPYPAQKALETLGRSIEAIVKGERDPGARPQDQPETIGCGREHISQALELYRVYQGKIAECDREIEAQLERFDDRGVGQSPAAKSGWRGAYPDPVVPDDGGGPED